MKTGGLEIQGKSTGPGTLSVIPFVINGGGAAITTGFWGQIRVPNKIQISKCTLIADVSGSITITIASDAITTCPPTTSIVASAKPTLASAISSEDSTLTGWTTTVNADNLLGFTVDTAATCKIVTVLLYYTKIV